MLIAALLALLGVPLWLVAVLLFVLIRRNRAIRGRLGNVRNRAKALGETRWRRGNGVWVHDVFAWRGTPQSWNERLEWIISVEEREPTVQERKKLHRLGENIAVVVLRDASGEACELAVDAAMRNLALGPFASTARLG